MEWTMPDLGEGVLEGEVIKWLVKEGETVSVDQHLVEIMTDKATMELPSPMQGKLTKILIPEGGIAKVGQGLAMIGEAGAGKMPAKEPAQEIKPRKKEDEETIDLQPPLPTVQPVQQTGEIISEHPLASPSVRRLAREKRIDLKRVIGSGPGGRVLAQDLETKREAPTSQAKQAWVSHGPEERKPLRGLRRKIAEHMSLSRKHAAHFSHFDECDFTELVKLREKEKKSALKKGVKLTYLAYVIKAVIQGLKKFPQMNASLDEATQDLVIKKYYNIGVAVATEQGLIVPNIKNADKKTLYELAKELTRLGEVARNNKITLEDLKGGTFTVTNIGSIGGILSAPIINYPESAIMGLHRIVPRPMVVGKKVQTRQMMFISISGDHRIVDGADVAAFLNEVKSVLEKPTK